MKRYAVLSFLTLVLSPAIVSAADVRVSYLVEATAFKSAVAGTPLSFALFSDGSCTTPVATQLANAEDVQLVEAVKPLAIKSAPTKPAKSTRLTHVLTGVTPQPALYLTVTGTGVAAVGAACQLQNASVNGTAAAASPSCPGDSASVLVSASTSTRRVSGTSRQPTPSSSRKSSTAPPRLPI